MDLRDLFTGRLSYRRLLVLVNMLPQESRTQTFLRDRPSDEPVDASGPTKFGPWALLNYQLASLIDAVNRNTYIASVAGRLEPTPKLPEPMPRPGMDRPVRRQSEANVAYLDRLRATG